MIDARKKVEAAIANRREDPEHVKVVTAYFEAQADLFTQCPKCHVGISGTKAEILAHQCES